MQNKVSATSPKSVGTGKSQNFTKKLHGIAPEQNLASAQPMGNSGFDPQKAYASMVKRHTEHFKDAGQAKNLTPMNVRKR